MNYFLKLDWILLIVVILLITVGLLALYSISLDENNAGLNHFSKQIISILIGAGLLLFFSFYDYRALSSYSTKLYFLILIILAVVAVAGETVRGTTGWIGLGPFHFQPVEIAKLVMILFLASFLSKKKTHLSILVRTVTSIILVLLPVILILKQPDLGSAAVIVGIWIGMLFVSGINKKILALLLIISVAGTFSSWHFLKDYQKERLVNFVSPKNDPQGGGYNVIQSTVAIGSGGIFGKGLGHGSQSQLNFLPEKHTDFIFAAIGEELGMVGALILFALFGFLFYRIKKTAALARDNFGYLLSVGVILMIFFQLAVNIGMNIGLAPVAGVPLPFLSYGGSSMITILASIGMIQSVYARRIKVA